MIVTRSREGEQQPKVRQKVNNSNRIFFRIAGSYTTFFQAMAEDYYQRGKIESPTIGLLAKTCLIIAGNAWNRMQAQLMNEKYKRKVQQQQQDPQNYQRSPEFIRASGDAPQSVASKRPPPVAEKTKRQLQQGADNLLNTPVTEWGYPTFTRRLDSSNMAPKRTQQHRSQAQSEDQSQ